MRRVFSLQSGQPGMSVRWVRLVPWRRSIQGSTTPEMMTDVSVTPTSTGNPTTDEQPGDPAFERELAALCVEALNLDLAVDDVDATLPLYEDGLGLDSIDILEIALVVSKRYGLQLRADDENNLHIFASLRSLARHIQAHRTR